MCCNVPTFLCVPAAVSQGGGAAALPFIPNGCRAVTGPAMSRPGDARSGSRLRGRLQARYSRLVRRFGGDKNPAAKKKAITAIAHTLLKIAYQVLKTGTPYQDLGADFYTRRESRQHKQAWL